MMKLMFVFPGQGSQFSGMLNDFVAVYPEIKQPFAEASKILSYDLWELIQTGGEEKLNKTEHTQPALLVASYALWNLWRQHSKIMPDLLAGHSLGEYSALLCSGVIQFADAVRLVQKRAQLMQAAVPEGIGAMAAIVGLADEKVIEICKQAAEIGVVEPANFNAIGQVVVGGELSAVQKAMELATANGAKLVKQLPMSVPSHCKLLRQAADKLAEFMHTITFATPKIPVIHNVDNTVQTDPEKIKQRLHAQLYQTVFWTQTIQFAVTQGITTVVECGVNRVLAGLNKRIAKEIVSYNLGDLNNFQKTLQTLKEEYAELNR